MRSAARMLIAMSLLALCAPAMAEERLRVEKANIDEAALEKLGWTLGCQAYTFRSLTLFETIDVLNGLGIRYIEMYPGQRYSPEHPDVRTDHNLSDEMIAQLKEKLSSANVKAVNYGVVRLTSDESQARPIFDFAKKMGITTIVSEPALDSFDLLERLCEVYDMSLAIHNHPAPSLYANCDTVVQAVEGRSDRIGACADIGHWYRTGLSAADCVGKLEGRIISMHFKDVGDDRHDVPWGTGNVNIRAVMEELKRQQARPMIAIEYERGTGQELIDNVRRSLEYFNEVARELAGQ